MKALVFSLICLSLAHLAYSIPTSTNNEDEAALAGKREFIVNMTRRAWNAYTENAWGTDGVRPVSKESLDTDNIGASIFASATTLSVMGLKSELERAKAWMQEFNVLKASSHVTGNDLIVNSIGSLLSLYATLGGGDMLLNKSKEIVNFVKPTFQTTTGLPYYFVDYSGKAKTNSALLRTLSIQQPEIIYLANLTSDSDLKQKNSKIKQFIKTVSKPKGLYLSKIDILTGEWVIPKFSSLISQEELLRNLINSYIQSNGQDVESLEMFNKAIDAAEQNGLIKATPRGLYFAKLYDHDTDKVSGIMDSSACFLGGLFAVTAHALNRNFSPNATMLKPPTPSEDATKLLARSERYWKFARGFTETCFLVANSTKTGILPSTFAANDTNIAVINSRGSLGPVLAESYFQLWRTTHDGKYRDYAWRMVQALEQHCLTESGGYTGIKDVNQRPTVDKFNYQLPTFLSATLKYLYLTFTDDSVHPLDQWIFNTVGHPLPIY